MAEANKYDFTKLNTLAVTSLAFAVTMMGAPAALITGYIALAQIKKNNQAGRGLALAGIILGYVAIGIGIIMFIVNLIYRGRYGNGLFNDDSFFPHRQDNDGDGNWNMPGMNN